MIIHILADGRKLKDITGHKVTRDNAPAAYEALERIKKQRRLQTNGNPDERGRKEAEKHL